MPSSLDELPLPDFEIDHFNDYAQYVLDQAQEIRFYLSLLAKRGELISAYLDQGEQSFLTTLLAVAPETGTLFFDPPQSAEHLVAATQARQVTLVTRLERVKIQFRIGALQAVTHEDRPALAAAPPQIMLRLQRREFFRLEPDVGTPIRCGMAFGNGETSQHGHELPVLDISAGGISLQAPTNLLNELEPGSVFKDCRLEIPDECVLQVNLQVRKVVEISAHTGPHTLRVGCSFVGLPALRQASIERYIARIERERTARNSGLSD